MSASAVSSERSASAPLAGPGAELAAELQRESAATRRILERVPKDKLDWAPHAKSMTLGQLAIHVASIPGGMARMARGDGFDVSTRQPKPAQPDPATDFVGHLDAGLAEAKEVLSSWTDADANATWRLSHGDREMFAIPKRQMVRTMMLNHWYHHRGQLAVYLRLLDVPIPVIYGRSADEGF